MNSEFIYEFVSTHVNIYEFMYENNLNEFIYELIYEYSDYEFIYEFIFE